MNSPNKQHGRTFMMRGALIVVFVVLLVSTFMFVFQSWSLGPSTTQTPVAAEKTPTAGAPAAAEAPQLEQVDSVLQQDLSASIAYNAPSTIMLNETATIELLLSPSLSPEALATQVVEGGQVTTGSIDITPRMKAVLVAQDDGLTVKPLEESPEQLVSGAETVKWTWFVTARKSGSHKLTLVIYRLINFEGKDYWREVESYKANIEVKVTIAQRIMMLDWKWIAGILISLIIIPAFWRWMDGKRKKGRKK